MALPLIPIGIGAAILAALFFSKSGGSSNVPPPPGTPPGEKPPVPGSPPPATPPTPSEHDAARVIAAQVASDVRAHGKAGYDRDLVKRFQALARLWVDGLYGPATAGAVQFFTGESPPAPVYWDKNHSYKVQPYTPPAGL